ncbi:hypothetical protein [Mucilaginibacter lappiensis]|uniref:KAP family P-loop domain-containing protein n=1 Tax=Mucilaginibacter lappiensis TaxID=354630 RepID=A0A841JKL3_9SPHI|nr:hypothetical protein [Mucilaginibacter lappiensis]MBB6131723.1 hypothetical protein [Mucilaginibacter lappiensis]
MESIIEILPANNSEKVLRSYLETETSYALLVNGRRGIGKTFFLKNKFLSQAAKVKVYHDQSKYYKPVYISLFGLSSMTEVYTLISLELLPFLKGKTIKISMGIAKMFIRGLLQYKRAGNIDDFLKDISRISKSALEMKELVLIFDDLDRLPDTVSITEFVGFVNSLVEHDNNKVIVIADQDSITDQKNYLAVKEKTIGTTVEFTAAFNDSFDQIVLEKYKKAGFEPYYKYLLELKPMIRELFQAAESTNLRTLIYFLQIFDKIFHDVYYELQLDQNDPDDLNRFKLQEIARFAGSVCIEFKSGSISYTNTQGIDEVAAINAQLTQEFLRKAFSDNMRRLNDSATSKEEKENEQSYKDAFVAKFYSNKTYHFYPSIFRFVTGGDDFNKNELLADLKEKIDDRRQKIYRQDELLNALGYPQCYDLDNDELRKLTAEMYELALQGLFSLDRYLSVFHFLERFPEILAYDPKEVTEKLKAAVREHAANFFYVPMLKEHFDVKQEQKNYEYFKDLFLVLNEVNEQVSKEMGCKNDLDLFTAFAQDPDSFYKAAYEQYSDRPILATWDFDAFYSRFREMTNNQLRGFSNFLKNRYLGYEMPRWTEMEFFALLKEKLNDKGEGEPTLRDMILEGLKEMIDQILQKPTLDALKMLNACNFFSNCAT